MAAMLLPLVCLLLATHPVRADHWVLGDEGSVHCYTLKGTPHPQTITTPVGLLMKWQKPIVERLEEGDPVSTAFEVSIPDEELFWSSLDPEVHKINRTKYQALCNRPCPSEPSLVGATTCCIFHANMHSCRTPASCEPWVKPANDTDGGTLVTHTAAQWGPWGVFEHELVLPEGTWNIIAHAKVLDFQCAIGAARTVLPRSTTPVALLVVVPTACVVLLLVGACVLWRMRKAGARDNSRAPKNPNAKVAVLFTDIQSSTSLWANVPQEMGEALDMHHREIRQLIKKYKCYEVKTIGDSFMIVSESPDKLMRLALELQTRFHELNWGTQLFDVIYRDAALEAWQETNKGEAPLMNNNDDTSLWNGIRVRCGLHYGICDIKYDPIVKGYDYYGPPINTAARIESVCHGGQIGMSDEMRLAVFGPVGSAATWQDLGEVALRGVPKPVQMYQALPVALAERKFPPLRVDEADSDDESDEEDFDDAVSVVTRAAPAIGRHPLVKKGRISAEDLKRNHDILVAGLQALFSTPAKKDKATALKIFCDRLKVPYKGIGQAEVQKTVQAISMRMLPSTVPQRGLHSRGTVVSLGTSRGPSPRSPRAGKYTSGP